MIPLLVLAFSLIQDPKPAAKTVEERLKELADRIEALDKKAAVLTDENAKLQQKVDEAKTRRDQIARQSGTAWVKGYAPVAEFTEKQSAEIEELWYGWTTKDMEKACDVAQWKTREETLRSKLTGDQPAKIARKVREDQERNGRSYISSLGQFAKLPAEKTAALEKAVMPKLTFEEGVLLPQAHPDASPVWTQILGGIEGSLADLSPALTEAETSALRKIIERWKPKSR